jgi:hypothetical protein
MKLILTMLVWGIMAAIIGFGILLAAKGTTLWLLVLSVLAFVIMVGKIGCATH